MGAAFRGIATISGQITRTLILPGLFWVGMQMLPQAQAQQTGPGGVPGGPVGGGAVSSVFGRTGAVTAAAGDYTAAQVTDAAATNAANTFTAAQAINSGSTATGLNLITTVSSSSLGLTSPVGTWTMSSVNDGSGDANMIFYSAFYSRQAFEIGEDVFSNTALVQVPKEMSYTWSSTGSVVDTTPQAGFSSPSAGVISADTSSQGNSAATVKMGGLVLTPYINTATGASPAINVTAGSGSGTMQQFTLSANATFTLTGLQAGTQLDLSVCNAAGNSFSATMPAAIHISSPFTPAAGTCTNYQLASFNGTTLIPMSAAVTGVAP